jgi:hypothetical protein
MADSEGKLSATLRIGPLPNHNTDSISSEVKWQVPFFALLALALGAMMQPCGNVLRTKARNHRFYIRASPIVCIADVAQFLFFILLGYDSDRNIWLKNIKFELKDRFSSESGAKDKGPAENSLVLRWILLILGASQFQVVKLMAMRGIPGTQTFAMMFGVAIIFGEVLILLVRSLDLDHGVVNTPPAWRSYKISKNLDGIRKFFTSLQSAFCQVVFILTLYHMLVLEERKMLKHQLVFCLGTVILTVLSSDFLISIIKRDKVNFALSLVVAYIVLMYYSFLGSDFFRSHVASWEIFIWTTCLGMFCGLRISLWAASDLFEDTWYARLFRYNQARLFRVNTPRGAQAARLSGLILFASTLYYGTLYDPSGTVNPDWTGVFG